MQWSKWAWLVVVAGVSPAAAQGGRPPDPTDSTFPIRDCSFPEGAVGSLSADGVVAYLLDRNGRPDTTTLRVLSVGRISVAGYQSAVRRRLSGCRFRLPRGLKPEGIAVSQGVDFAPDRQSMRTANRLDSLPAGLPLVPVLIPTEGLPLPVGSRLLEEHPVMSGGSSCRPPSNGSPPGGTFRSEEEANRAFDTWAAENSGRVLATVEVGVDGRAVPGTARTIETDNPRVANNLLRTIEKCRFAPGRIGGVPVPAIAQTAQGSSVERRSF